MVMVIMRARAYGTPKLTKLLTLPYDSGTLQEDLRIAFQVDLVRLPTTSLITTTT